MVCGRLLALIDESNDSMKVGCIDPLPPDDYIRIKTQVKDVLELRSTGDELLPVFHTRIEDTVIPLTGSGMDIPSPYCDR